MDVNSVRSSLRLIITFFKTNDEDPHFQIAAAAHTSRTKIPFFILNRNLKNAVRK